MFSRLVFLTPLVAGGLVLLIISCLANAFEWIIDAAWFGLEEKPVAIEFPGALSVSFFFVSLILWIIFRLSSSFIDDLEQNLVSTWIEKFLVFLIIYHWIVGLHQIIIIERSGSSSILWAWGAIFEIIIVSSIVALAWTAAFGLHSCSYLRDIFLVSCVVLGIFLVFIYPDILLMILASSDLIEDPKCLMIGSSFPALVYIAPIPPMLWMTINSWRNRSET